MNLNLLKRSSGQATVLAFTCSTAGSGGQRSELATAAPSRDALTLDATVTSEVIPDLAVIACRRGAGRRSSADHPRSAAGDQRRPAQAKAAAGVEARTGRSPPASWNSKGGRDGWTVRAELILKARISRRSVPRWQTRPAKLMIVGSALGSRASCAGVSRRWSSVASRPSTQSANRQPRFRLRALHVA